LAFDYRSWHEQLAGVARIFIHDARGDRFTALERRARIEVGALAARVQFRFAFRARAFKSNAGGRLRSARGALHRLTKGHHLRRAWPLPIDRLRLRLRTLRLRSLRLAIIIHVAAMTIFAVTHELLQRNKDKPMIRELRFSGYNEAQM
jgi:hypothetical protein